MCEQSARLLSEKAEDFADKLFSSTSFSERLRFTSAVFKHFTNNKFVFKQNWHTCQEDSKIGIFFPIRSSRSSEKLKKFNFHTLEEYSQNHCLIFFNPLLLNFFFFFFRFFFLLKKRIIKSYLFPSISEISFVALYIYRCHCFQFSELTQTGIIYPKLLRQLSMTFKMQFKTLFVNPQNKTNIIQTGWPFSNATTSFYFVQKFQMFVHVSKS